MSEQKMTRKMLHLLRPVDPADIRPPSILMSPPIEARHRSARPNQLSTLPLVLARARGSELLDPKKSATASSEWTPEWVGERLLEAARTVARMPMRVWPQGYSGLWPEFKQENDSERNEAYALGELDLRYATANRVRVPPSADQIERADEAICWPMRYLRGDPQLAAIVTGWAAEMFRPDEDIPPPVLSGLRITAAGLTRDRVRVR